jgi:hypothetical protein
MYSENDDFEQLKKATYEYTQIVLAYIHIQEELLMNCHTEQEWRKVGEQANVYLAPGFMNEHTDLQLYELVLSEWKIILKDVSYGFQNRFVQQED